MTLFRPSLLVRRLVIRRGDQAVYDEAFHAGVNVLRGENSSGKSTVLNFIFYGLGGDLYDWSQVALLCTDVTVEVELNGNPATLRREIVEQPGQPMEIFGGPLEEAVLAPRDSWMRYPYKRSDSTESFSQTLFRILGLPEVANEVSGNITVHQILRLLYADQLSPVESIFRFDRFDPPALRDAVGRLLCGAYDSTIYENEVSIRALTREFDSVSAELRSLVQVLGQADQAAGLEWLEQQRSRLEMRRGEINAAIEAAELRMFDEGSARHLTREAQRTIYNRLQILQADISGQERERESLILAIGDSLRFIQGLENKIAALGDSNLVAQHLGDVHFSTCPACYAPVEGQTADSKECHLCKSAFDGERLRSRIVGLVNETAVQLKQSQLLQRRREERIIRIEASLEKLRSDWQAAAAELDILDRTPSSDAQVQLRRLNRDAGYLEREIEDLTEKERVAGLIARLADQKEALNTQISQLKGRVELGKMRQGARLNKAYSLVADQVRDLLRNDLRRQDSFEDPKTIDFDFSTNRISVDGLSYFSASSRVVLRSSFFLGFLAASTEDAEFRHPRFLMLDTVEDKGMEPERSHNFQVQILRKSTEARCRHQIIYATAMIAPALDDESYVVGKFSTRDDPTIAIRI